VLQTVTDLVPAEPGNRRAGGLIAICPLTQSPVVRIYIQGDISTKRREAVRMDWVAEGGTVHENCAVIFKTDGEFGALSNMASGYPLRVNGELIGSSEALYQASRFPHQPDWQREIISQSNPMTAKMKAKKDGRRKDHSRPDWDQVRVDVMRWVLRVKLAQHYPALSALLRATGDRPIVEQSRDDDFWGAREKGGRLVGTNQMGRLLMELRQLVQTASREELGIVEPPTIPGLLLLGKPIQRLKAYTPPKE
jgi:ribA/ribD-fused uncharacterized protein